MNTSSDTRQELAKAFSHHQAGRYSEAKQLYESILKYSPDHSDALHLMGLVHHQQGSNETGAEFIRKAISHQPANVFYHMNLASVLQAADKADEALSCYRKVTELQPDNADAWYHMANIYKKQDKTEDAVSAYKKALALNPNRSEICNSLANTLRNRGDVEDALFYYQQAVSIKPDYVSAYSNMGVALMDLNRVEEALSSYEKAISLNPSYAEAYNNMGIALKSQGKISEAMSCYEKALSVRPDFAEVYNNMGVCEKDRGNADKALLYYRKALEIRHDYLEPLRNMGGVLAEQGKGEDAVACYQRALQIRPDSADTYNSMGIALKGLNRLHEALDAYRKAAEIKPDDVPVYCNMALCLRWLGKTDDAVACYRKILELKPDTPEAYSSLLHQLQHVCAWQEVADILPGMDAMTQELLEKGERTSETPFENLTRHANPALNLSVAKSWSAAIEKSVAHLERNFSFENRRIHKQKIRIGYLSSDFHNHATAHLILGLFRHHNKEEFEIFSYSYGREDSSFYRDQICKGSEQFRDIRFADHGKAAKQIYEDQIDILVDLKGHTKDNRLEICALRPAPVQVTWLGFPGSIGADFLDYMITDSIVTPEEHRQFYAEKCILLPHCYQINDNQQAISEETFTRAGFGLPENAFVFASFNQVYKIEPVIFDVWMNLLRNIPGSVLWVLRGSESARNALWKEVEKRGVEKERLIFAGPMLKPRHLARIRIADLCLDTRIVNGHTTTSDALWAGVPVVAMQGDHFASRVSSSILQAIGLPELITHNPEQYENLALHLATHPLELRNLREKLQKNRVTQPLFDTAGFVANLERAYREIWNLFLAGRKAEHVKISPLTSATLSNRSPAQPVIEHCRNHRTSQQPVIERSRNHHFPLERGMETEKELQRAIAFHQAGKIKAAQEIYAKILTQNPNHANALHLSGLAAFQSGDHESAVQQIQKAIGIFPHDPVYHINLSAVFLSSRKYDDAISCYENIIQMQPDQADAYIRMGSVYKEKGEKEKAISCFEKAMNLKSADPGTWVNLGVQMKSLSRPEDALICYEKALSLQPDFAEVHYNIGNVLREQARPEEALVRYQEAVRLKPSYSEAWYNIGNTFRDLKRVNDALSAYRKALELNPVFADALNNMGLVYKEMGRNEDAVSCYKKALEIRPDYSLACFNMGNVFKDEKKFREAADCFEKAIEIKPDYAEAYSSLVHLLQHMCEWERFAQLTPGLDHLTSDLLAKDRKAGETPFMNLVRCADPHRNLLVAQSWAKDISQSVSKLNIHFSHDKIKSEHKGKIVIGYLSNDFRNHPVAHLIVRLFGLHNRDEFEIHAYSYGPNDESYYRKQIESGCDKFVDLRDISTPDAVRIIHENRVGILLDLMGYTGDTNRLDICALRPAPVQVSFLGFPGTGGADFFDYMITDKIVSPQEHSHFYKESLVYMPHAYQVNDNLQKIDEKNWKRSDFGLPEKDFVFCCFNQSYKIEPLMFDTWMRILARVPQSVLWLLGGSEIAEKNLKKEAEKRGTDPQRIIFAPRMQKTEHLSRHRLADLSLDTRIVNGHTTSSDSLWAGVPLIALLGTHFASRVAASLLSAVGLPELIVRNLNEYESLAVRLAQNPQECRQIRDKLAANRVKEPLFDTPRFARNLEKAFKEMWRVFKAGEKPRPIFVTEDNIFENKAKSVPVPISASGIQEKLVKAVGFHQAGQLDSAENIYKEILALQPDNPDALHFLGVIFHQKNLHDKAAELIQKAIATFQGNPLYYANLAAVFHAQGRSEDAVSSFRNALKANPQYAPAWYGMANILLNMEKVDEALSAYQKFVEMNPDNAGGWYGMGNAHYAKKDMEKAVSAYEKAVQLKPDYAEVYNNLGVAYQAVEKNEQAMKVYEKALALKPDYAEVYSNIGNLHKQENRIPQALECYRKALDLRPDYAQAFNNMGVVLQEQGNIAQALESFENALKIQPDYAEVLNNMGFAFKQEDRIKDALDCYKKALALKPNYAEVYHNMGNAYQEFNIPDKTVACYEKALELKPDYAEVYNNLVLQLQLICDWKRLEPVASALDDLTRKALEKEEKTPELPFANLVRHMDLALNLAVAKSRSAGLVKSIGSHHQRFSFENRKDHKTQIVLGYLSNDFHDHATSHLILRLFELHNREKFRIHVYSYGMDDKSHYRKKIEKDADLFADLRKTGHADAAQKIYDDKVDILIDLKGYTKGNRVGICAFRPAPVQVSWLGFPGTTGADFFDYIITDSIVTPDSHSQFYSEKIVWMPHCYQINDNTQHIAEKIFTRADFALPEDAVVFCSFNQLYKIAPELFDIWMQILRHAEKSVLWLPDGGKTASSNLKNEAEKRGVNSNRIVFSEKLPKAEHLSRLRLADLCLDTRIVNGHTTTSDALWAGVPVLTWIGNHFASRVAASILTAVGLPDLIAHTEQEYTDRAVQLAKNPNELAQIRIKLAENRMKKPLFDTPRFVKNLEKAFEIMWNKYQSGEKASDIKVE
ncbi:MAG: tetratricopeptide repeat protein [Desulfococcaceae bacterium]